MRVVIDTEVRPATQSSPDEIDELLERRLLGCAIGRTKRTKADSPIVDRDSAKQVFETAIIIEERKAFHVEEHVACRRWREESESVLLPRGQQVVSMLAGLSGLE
jgi:chorismate mutase